MFNGKSVIDTMSQKIKLEHQLIEARIALDREKRKIWFTEEELNIFEEMITVFYGADTPSKESILLAIETYRSK
jgi:hypothetical protein